MRDTLDAARCAVGVCGYDSCRGHAEPTLPLDLGPVAVLNAPAGPTPFWGLSLSSQPVTLRSTRRAVAHQIN